MISYKYSKVGGYSCAVIATVGFILNTTTFIVLGSEKKLRQQPTTVIILVITMFDIFYTAVILPFHAINILDCWSVILSSLVFNCFILCQVLQQHQHPVQDVCLQSLHDHGLCPLAPGRAGHQLVGCSVHTLLVFGQENCVCFSHGLFGPFFHNGFACIRSMGGPWV